ncbi:MAG: hypothetical protein MHPDNHAH_02689 [Anaerolineales bacterium]|nr:hypothetical protein [Anaerolineales bacterium]
MLFELETKISPTGFPSVAKTLPHAVKRIVTALKPEKIILFGSYAEGNATHDSDVDLLVIMNNGRNSKENHRAISMLLYPRQFPVDIIVKTPEEVRAAIRGGVNNGFFIREIMKKGKVLYDRDKGT